MKRGWNHPVDPLALADLTGLDVLLSVMEALHRELDEDNYCPCAKLREMVDAGYLGSKTGVAYSSIHDHGMRIERRSP